LPRDRKASRLVKTSDSSLRLENIATLTIMLARLLTRLSVGSHAGDPAESLET